MALPRAPTTHPRPTNPASLSPLGLNDVILELKCSFATAPAGKPLFLPHLASSRKEAPR